MNTSPEFPPQQSPRGVAEVRERDSRIPPVPAGLLWIATGSYGALGLVVMAWLSPKVPYADAWRHLARILATPFPANVLAVDNGHREVLPNLVRLLELHWFGADQWLQIAFGMLLSLATAALLLHGIRRARVDRTVRAAAAFFAVTGLYWLGNERALAHGNESAHVYLVTLCLVSGTLLLAGAPVKGSGVARAWFAGALGFLAAFSFGSGIACFMAFLATLALRQASFRQWLPLLACLGFTAVFFLPAGDDGNMQIAVMPVQQTDLLLRWLAGPSMYSVWPLVDPSLAAHIPPGEVRSLATVIASAFVATFGPPLTARWPALLIGILGVAWLAASSWSSWRNRATVPAMARVGLALAWFALTVGALIVLARLQYFFRYPGQLLAPRYIPWSSLFWAGLALSSVLSLPPRASRGVAALTLLIALALLPSQVWMGKQAAGQRVVADQTALAAANGVIDPALQLGESVVPEIAAALPLLRQRHAAMFGWTEALWLGRRPTASGLVLLSPDRLHVSVVDNLLGADGFQVRFQLDGPAAPRVVLIDSSGVVVGVAEPDERAGRGSWIGWAQDTRARGPLRVAAVPGRGIR